MLPVTIEADDVDAAMRGLVAAMAGETYEQQLMGLAPVVYAEFSDHFRDARGPDGPWAPRARAYPWPPLVHTGKLSYAAIVPQGHGNITRWRDGWAEFGLDATVVNYAGFHEYGTSRMPARPWCWLSPEAEDEATERFADAVVNLFFG